MSDYMDHEAVESEDEELSDQERDQDDQQARSTPSKKKKAMISSDEDDDDEEDDEDEEKAKEEMKGFIADDDDEEEGSNRSGSDSEGSDSVSRHHRKKKKRRRSRSRSRSDEDLDEDDMELLQENLGMKIKKQRKRIKIDSGSEDDDDVDEETRDNDELPDIDQPSRDDANEAEGYDDEDDVDDFIVGPDGEPIKRDRKKKKKHIFSDSARQNAEDVFGVKFDYDEFAKYSDEDYESDEDEDEEEGDEDEDEMGERRGRKKKMRRKKQTQTIFDLCDPNELEARHYTDLDNEIRNLDVPERMQLRQTPVTSVPEGSDELDREADWVFKYGFTEETLSQQDTRNKISYWISKDAGDKGIIRQQIKCTLDFIRQQSFEVPFIANYRKEYVPDLKINDLWLIYEYDEMWCKLQQRKKNLSSLMGKMQIYQSETIMADPDAPLPEDAKIISNDDLARIDAIETFEELKDRDQYFKLYYGDDIEAMQAMMRKKRREEKETKKLLKKRAKKKKTKIITNDEGEEIEVTDNEASDEEEEEENEEEDEAEELDDQDVYKQARRKDMYTLCKKGGIFGMSQRFGLTADQFGVNLENNYQKVDVEQDPQEPLEVAAIYSEKSQKFKDPVDVLRAAKYMLATQISRDPAVRQITRDHFFKRATIDIRPTKLGMKEIDELHDCYPVKYLKGKPVRDLNGDQWLKILQAEEAKLIELHLGSEIIVFGNTTLLYEAKQLFRYDGYSKSITEWNNLRDEILEMAFKKMLYPMLRQELKLKLIKEAKDGVLQVCRNKLFDWLRIGKYTVTFEEEDEDDWDSSQGCRIMAISYESDPDVAAYAVCISTQGEVDEFLRLEHFCKPNIMGKPPKEREDSLESLREFISSRKPHCIVIGVADRLALDIQKDVEGLVDDLVQREQFPKLGVHLADDNLAKVFANSKRAEQDFRDYPIVLRQAISLARRMQDPLTEFSQLCGPENEILCLRYHPMQDQLSEEELLNGITIEFVNRVNEVGVDINECVVHPHISNLVQFVGGLGPRKGMALLKTLRQMQSSQKLENRQQLVTLCHMGPKVLINCAGFIKIDTSSLGDSEVYVEVLDGSRIHNEAYEWARKMAVDALEYDEDDNNPATALDEILQEPEKLAELDLDAFAQELERQGFGKKSITLQDIRDELHHMYKDKRDPYVPPTPEEIFNMVTKETPQTFYIGKLIQATVTSFAFKRTTEDELNKAAPIRKQDQYQWQCPFCGQDDFPELTEVWNHFDADACPGKAVGVRVRLDNGCSGFISMKNLSDSNVLNPKERVKPRMNIFCRIIRIIPEKLQVDLVCKSSALEDRNNEWKPQKDHYYDHESEKEDLEKESAKKQQKQRQAYTKRVIHHQNFYNIGYKEAEKLMANMDQGEAIIRPSSKGVDHLTVTWKVTDDIYQHIDIREEGKINAFTRGKSLLIGNEEFEDLDEIIARHINPMAANARDILAFKYYKETNGGNRDRAKEIIMQEKASQPNKIHYLLSASKELPGKFLLSYMPRQNVRHEYITVTPDGFRFRKQHFDTLSMLMKWFKEHFRDAIPGTPVTPGGRTTNRTPYMTGTPGGIITPGAMSLATGTPYGATPGGGIGGANTPYTPTANTPFMTPYNTPGNNMTPRAGGQAIPPYRGGTTPSRQQPSGMARTSMPPPIVGGHSTPGSSTPSGHRSSGSRHVPYPSPSTYGSYNRQSPAGRQRRGDPDAWQTATDSWARGGRRTPANTTPKGYSGSTTPRYEENSSKRTPGETGGGNRVRRTPKYGEDGKRTPKTFADATPLYDE